jgi:hypothetical protein
MHTKGHLLLLGLLLTGCGASEGQQGTLNNSPPVQPVQTDTQPVNLIVKPEPIKVDPVDPGKPIDSEPVKPIDVIPIQPPPPPVRTWTINASLRDGGSVAGTLTYEIDEAIQFTNVRSLQPNVTYVLKEYDLTVTTSFEDPIRFTNTLPIKYEFCLGSCIFAASQGSERLWWSDDVHQLQLVFQRPPLPALTLPDTVADWGPIDVQASWARSPRYTILLASGSIQSYVLP